MDSGDVRSRVHEESDADRKGMVHTQLPNDSVIFRTSERLGWNANFAARKNSVRLGEKWYSVEAHLQHRGVH
jgi:hypothetical protein